jgi:hypothetical protein
MKPSIRKRRVLPLTIHSLRPLLDDVLPQVAGGTVLNGYCYKVTLNGCPCPSTVTH